jgi:hypothetical protein
LANRDKGIGQKGPRGIVRSQEGPGGKEGPREAKRDQEGPGGVTRGVRISHDGPGGAKRGQGEAKKCQEGRKWSGGAPYRLFFFEQESNPKQLSNIALNSNVILSALNRRVIPPWKNRREMRESNPAPKRRWLHLWTIKGSRPGLSLEKYLPWKNNN